MISRLSSTRLSTENSDSDSSKPAAPVPAAKAPARNKWEGEDEDDGGVAVRDALIFRSPIASNIYY